MGDGLVLEGGTHEELLTRRGAYYRLVQTQKLRERVVEGDVEEIEDEKADYVGKIPSEDNPLARKNTGRSLASANLEQKRRAAEGAKNEGDFSIFQVFMRMAKLNREGWANYILGGLCAISMRFIWLRALGYFLFHDCSVWDGLSGIRNRLREGYCRFLCPYY